MKNKIFWIIKFIAILLNPKIKTHGFVKIDPSVEFILEPKSKLILNKGVQIRKGSTIYVKDSLSIEKDVFIGHFCTIAFEEPTIIKEGTMMAEMVSIRDHDHDYQKEGPSLLEKSTISSAITFGNNLWIGAKATITKGVSLGDNAVIGANSVVTKNVKQKTVVAGTPAKLIKSY
jgi:acetyltransferase-like isoleucine patch superfamily enzyme